MVELDRIINEKYQNFIASYDHAPEYLYLGETAYEAFVIMLKDMVAPESLELPFMGMKVKQVVGDKSHINVA